MTKRSVGDGFVPRRTPGIIGSDVNRKLPAADLTGFQRTKVPQPSEAEKSYRQEAIANLKQTR